MSKMKMGSWLAMSWVVVGCSGGDPVVTPSVTPPNPPNEIVPPPVVPPETAPSVAAAPAAAANVDLLHAVPTTVRVSTALSDNPEQIARLVDGDLTTAWNSQTEDLVGAFIEVQLPAAARVTSIEMTSGFTHQRPNRDLFAGNHRVARVRVMHDGVEVGTYPLSTSDQALQALPVTGSGGTYRVELLEVVAGDQPTWREACVSELHVIGQAPTMTPNTLTPTLAIVPAATRSAIRDAILAAALGAPDAGPVDDTGVPEDELAVDEGADELLADEYNSEGEGDMDAQEAIQVVEDVASGSVLVPGEGLRLTELTVAAGVERREAVDPRTTFSKATDERVYCMVRLANPDRIPTAITVRFEPIDHPERGRDSELDVPGGATYTTFTYNGTRGRAGLYRCVVRDSAGALLGSAAWQLTE
jgi:hypothetical protein